MMMMLVCPGEQSQSSACWLIDLCLSLPSVCVSSADGREREREWEQVQAMLADQDRRMELLREEVNKKEEERRLTEEELHRSQQDGQALRQVVADLEMIKQELEGQLRDRKRGRDSELEVSTAARTGTGL